jgi:DNA-directed RNA polymerase specialized sigma24 family protein
MRRKKPSEGAFLIDSKQFDALMNKLDTLIKVTSASVFRGEKLTEGIVFLSDLGFTAKELAKILDTSEQYVYNVTSKARQEQKQTTQETKKEKTPEEQTPKPTE